MISKITNLYHAKYFKTFTIVVGAILIALTSFAVGMSVGFHKAKFSYKWGENYERNFAGPGMGGPMGFMHDFQGRDFRNSHGTAGVIVSLTDNNLVIKDRDGKENTVAVTDKTVIKKYREDIKITDLKQGDQVVVLGNPGNDGTINADIIRVFDNPADLNNNSASQIN